jgi:3-dehydroquinate synthase
LNVEKIEVALADRSYPILIGPGLSAGHPLLESLVRGRQVAVVTNDRVAQLHGARLRTALAASARLIEIRLPEGEDHKDWSSLDRIFEGLLEARFDRRSLIVAFGGGVVGDVAGFAAAIYQRGIDFVQVPTTLLAQVDSSVGGKTAINHRLGKNMVGAFHQPRLVLADTDTLATLPPREVSAGLAEMIKHGAIADLDYLDSLERDMGMLRACEPVAMARAVRRSCEIKAQVVAADERESDVRAILNFGHTFGHAIEAGAGYGRWLHGEAVGCGMVMAADLSCRLGMIDRAFAERLIRLIAAAGLPVRGPAWPPEQYLGWMSTDKKADQGTPRFVLLDSPGRAVLKPVPREAVEATLRACSDEASRIS